MAPLCPATLSWEPPQPMRLDLMGAQVYSDDHVDNAQCSFPSTSFP
jgi:hypothetical protein